MHIAKKINWSKYFDRVFCTYYLPNKKRYARLNDELLRVGLLDSPIFEWRFTTPSPYDEVIQNSFVDKKWINKIGCINVALETLRILKESRLLGYQRILLLEDDVAFLKDLNALEKILEDLPSDYDLIQLDKGCWGKNKVAEWNIVKKRSINDSFCDAGSYHFGLSDANVYTKSGMEIAIRILDYKPIACDQLNAKGDFKSAVARENACIQILFEGSNYNNGIGCHCIYKDIGIDYQQYSIPQGYGYSTLYNPEATDIKTEKKTQKAIVNENKTKGIWDAFDYIGCICYTKYKDRIEALLPELDRVGLKEKVHFHWDTPSIFRDKLSSVVKKTPFCSRGGCFNMTVQHYSLIKTAYDLGYMNVLVFEDDIRFLKDIELLEKLLESIPMNYDHLMFDRNKLTDIDETEFGELPYEQRQKKWIPFSACGSTGCYAMSRRGMRNYLSLIEADVNSGKVHNPDFYFRKQIHDKVFWDDSYHRFFCWPNLAVQSIVGDNGSFSDLSDYWKNLDKCCVSQSDYNLPFPIVTKINYADLALDSRTNSEAKTKSGIELWGLLPTPRNIKNLQYAIKNKEDVILKPADLYSAYELIGEYEETNIESLLNDFGLIITPRQRLAARELIEKITSSKVSYKDGQDYAPKLGRDNIRKVLVEGQPYQKSSHLHQDADPTIFKKMLQVAKEENPDADIIVDTYPIGFESHIGEQNGAYQKIESSDNIYKLTTPINPYALLNQCDKVYVNSSPIGFESLMAGKEVHVFGSPFYAGWGLTIDTQHLDRRTNMRTLEELVYIFFYMYTHWVDPEKGCETTIDAVIDKMIALRKGGDGKQESLLKTPSSLQDGYSVYHRSAFKRPRVYMGKPSPWVNGGMSPRSMNW